MVKAATSDKLKEMDWAKNIEICELVAQDPGKAKDVIKSIKKCIGGRSKNTQLYAVMLLEMLMNNCGEPIHRQVIDNGLLPILVKIVKKKTELPVREKIFLLLDATQTSLGGAKARFPQYYDAYYELVSAGVQFSNCPNVVVTRAEVPVPETRTEPNMESLSARLNEAQQEVHTQPASDTSIVRKASSVMEVLRDVLNSMDPRHPEGATDEFVLDLVEQCTFQKQRIMHLVMTSRDEALVSQAIELNEELHKVLVRHDALLSVQPIVTEIGVGAPYLDPGSSFRFRGRGQSGSLYHFKIGSRSNSEWVACEMEGQKILMLVRISGDWLWICSSTTKELGEVVMEHIRSFISNTCI
ncbi:unnamed protein product [Urochloa humidicola]